MVAGKKATTFKKGELIWLRDDTEYAIPVRVVHDFVKGKPGYVAPLEDVATTPKSTKRGKSALPKTKNIQLSATESASAEKVDQHTLQGVDNMVNMKDKDITAASILYNVKVRFSQDKIYTSIGTVLLSVNPFKLLPLYTPDTLEQYKTGTKSSSAKLAPHIYQVADRAYKQMVKSNMSQSCLISGESGSGKTEATKIFLQYLTEISRNKDVHQNRNSVHPYLSNTHLLQEQILKANPLLESFGNAQTTKNDNSSRFGKWIEIRFNNKMGSIVGGSITNYLLEKSRLVQQSAGERNYHIFYELCAAAEADDKLRKRYHIKDASEYNYLVPTAPANTRTSNQSAQSLVKVERINDQRGFEEMLSAMAVLNLTPKEKDDILRTLAGILHLGNVEFSENDKGESQVTKSSKPMLELAADQLGCPDASVLSKALTTQNVSNAKEQVFKTYNFKQALDARDALAKSVYGKLFEWLILRVNQVLNHTDANNTASNAKPSPPRVASVSSLDHDGDDEEDISVIGVLDIFGFESLGSNSFEQLCINYCNEKLQAFFNNHIFQLEQDEYVAQGIDASRLEFQDNAETIALMEPKPMGLLAMLDEETSVPRGTDESFLNKVMTIHAKNSRILQKKGANTKTTFTVVHFAQDVTYKVNGFLEKNKDILHRDLESVCVNSSHGFIAGLFQKATRASRNNNKSGDKPSMKRRNTTTDNKKTLGRQFKEQLVSLMATLDATNPHFVRCIKPNNKQHPDLFDANLVLGQLRHSGVLEVCKIKKSGYPHQERFRDFVFRYQVLVPAFTAEMLDGANVDEFCAALVDKKILPKSKQQSPNGGKDWQVGHSKLFMRHNVYETLELARERALVPRVKVIQRHLRGYLGRKRYAKFQAVLRNLRQAVEGSDQEALDNALMDLGDLPGKGAHLPVVKDADKARSRIREETVLKARLRKAIASEQTAELKGALESVVASPLLNKNKDAVELVEQGTAILKRLKNKEKVFGLLQTAVNRADHGKLTTAIKKADASAFDFSKSSDYLQAKALLVRLDEERAAVRAVESAIKAKDDKKIKLATKALSAMGLDKHPIMKKAKKVATVEASRSQEVQAHLKTLEKQAKRACKHVELGSLDDLKTATIKLGRDLAFSETVKDALKLHHLLQPVRPTIEELVATSKTLTIKSDAPGGISEDDVKPLRNGIKALEKALKKQSKLKRFELDRRLVALVSARELEAQKREQVQVQRELEDVFENGDVDRMKDVLRRATDLDLKVSIADKVRELVREKVMTVGQKQESGGEDASKSGKTKSKRAASTKIPPPLPPRRKTQPVQVEQLGGPVSSPENELRVERARQDRFHFSKFYAIRDDVDYAKGSYFNKRKITEMKLRFQSQPINKSILRLDPELSKTAVRIHRAILGYCGDLMMPFPTTLAQNLLQKGLDAPELADEIYIQLFKQITDNPDATSQQRAWQLLCMVVGTFAPSRDFEVFTFNFFTLHDKIPGVIGTYAEYALRRLEGTLAQLPLGVLPSLEEILAYAERPPVLADVQLIDGSFVAARLPISPSLKVREVVSVCAHFMGIDEADEKLFGVFTSARPAKVVVPSLKIRQVLIPIGGNNSVRLGRDRPSSSVTTVSSNTTATTVEDEGYALRPLAADDFVGDRVLKAKQHNLELKFVFKFKLFLSRKLGGLKFGKNPVLDRLMYLQTKREVEKGTWPVNSPTKVAELAALSMAITNKGAQPKSTSEMDFNLLKSAIPVPWWDRKENLENLDVTEENVRKNTDENAEDLLQYGNYGQVWSERVLGAVQRTMKPKADVKDLVVQYLRLAKKLEFFGTYFAFVRQMSATSKTTDLVSEESESVVCGVSAHGFSLCTLEHEVVEFHAFKSILNVGGSSVKFWVDLGGKGHDKKRIVLWSPQSNDLVQLLRDYSVALQHSFGKKARLIAKA